MKSNLGLKLSVNMSLKLALLMATVVMGSILAPSSAHASASEKRSCRVETTDVGTITGHARGEISALEDAATQCFDRHDQLSLKVHGRLMDEEAGITVIDQCANIKCT